MEKYILNYEKELGCGAFGKVYHCIEKETGKEFACKIVEEPRYIEDSKVEVEILEKFKDANYCVQMKEYFTDKENGKFVIIFELLGESLYDIIEKKEYKKLDLKNTARQILLGLKEIHKQGYIHFDLKVENILFRGDSSNLKIIDFGSAIKINKSRRPKIGQTRHYRAPEIMGGRKHWDEKVDIWSFGCIMMELYTGELLFNTHDTVEHFMLIEKLLGVRIFNNREKLPNNKYVNSQPPLSHLVDQNDYLFLDFIKYCLEVCPDMRWSVSELLRHEFLN